MFASKMKHSLKLSAGAGLKRSTGTKLSIPDKSKGFLLLAGLQFCIVSNCLAGPPLMTDDPGILEPGTWEVIAAVAGEDRRAAETYHAPLLDVSVGIGGDSQISLFVPRLVIRPEDGETKDGLGFVSMAYKWRFAERSGWEWAIAPNYRLPVSHQVIRRGGPEDIRVLGLPLLVSRTEGVWTWCWQAAWNMGSDGFHWWDYGFSVSRTTGESLQWMSEIYGSATSSFEESTLNYQLGLDYGISPNLHLLASAGSGIKSISEPGFRLNYTFYLGLRWTH
jgi:hypothetical protein